MSTIKQQPHICFLQFGDFAQAIERFNQGGDETYRDQKSSVEFVLHLSKEYQVSVVSFGENAGREELSDTLRCFKLPFEAYGSKAQITRLLNSLQVDFFICRTPNKYALSWSRNKRIRTLPLFADTFKSTSIKERIQNYLLGNLLRSKHFYCVSNHSLNASESLHTNLKLDPKKIVPWDWSKLPIRQQLKKHSQQLATVTKIFYAGAVTKEKGVEECIKSIASLDKAGVYAELNIAGKGQVSKMQELAEELNISSKVNFLGLVSNREARRHMCNSDVIVVPSRHSYPEGLPNTIYEALASRTPLIISDHRAFSGRLTHKKDALIFKAGNSDSLADMIKLLIEDADLYEGLSAESSRCLESLYIGMEWRDLISNFLSDSRNSSGWVEGNSLKIILEEKNRSEG